MPVEDADPRRALAELREERVDRTERIVLLGHEDAPERIDDEHSVLDDPAFTGISRGQVQRPDAELERVDLFEKGALVPDMVSVGDDVGARTVDLACDLTREARTAGGVLTIQDHEIDVSFAPDRGEQCGNGLAAGLSDNVADEEDPHTEVSKGARSADRRSRCRRRPSRRCRSRGRCTDRRVRCTCCRRRAGAGATGIARRSRRSWL